MIADIIVYILVALALVIGWVFYYYPDLKAWVENGYRFEWRGLFLWRSVVDLGVNGTVIVGFIYYWWPPDGGIDMILLGIGAAIALLNVLLSATGRYLRQ